VLMVFRGRTRMTVKVTLSDAKQAADGRST
jgi:hypothetical protein